MVRPPDFDALVTRRRASPSTPSSRATATTSSSGRRLPAPGHELPGPRGVAGELGAAGPDSGVFDTTIGFRTAPLGGSLPLAVGRRRTGALKISRLALPLPPLLPSVNQIGFDSYDMIAGTLRRTKAKPHGPGRALMWVVGARSAGETACCARPARQLRLPARGHLSA